ncbi:LOW QUALITY PROTEIN: probable N-acetylgalactosaminyltransferase 9 [Haliotis rubra]|uniref:LOW QUALITY PROTEIN: probable N-acetylgalactosaminyltransferase 9 n=1 Tax=Haliotis rubra TaxID=36100 RepID=UPI001EE61DAB|nr:LOW QUALITY PROTEIN: probable N-acetylgalactosaminyltransferase 9 [Haliotis rubra]
MRSEELPTHVLFMRKKRFDAYQARELLRTGPGEKGLPVHLEGEEKLLGEKLMQKEAFNIVASEKISLERSVKDVRDHRCKDIIYPKNLPSASVIIIYHNEAWTPLLRTVHSVINRSPPEYLHEVILLDDFSDRPELGDKLRTYVEKTWPDGIVKMVRAQQRSGLIRARIEGAKAATGDVIVFLDSHCEAGTQWLEPILAHIQENRKTVVCPIIDAINDNTLEYSSVGGYNVGGFSWSMHFTWRDVPEREKVHRKYTDPISSPTMAGGLLALDRKFFWEIGAYDDGMDVWGGENLEISFRTWMCGGRLEFLPCSRVGHIFRSSHPYTFPGGKDTHGLNSARVAEVWMDDYKRLFYMHRHDLKNKDFGDISARVDLRKKLQCKSFKWYLDNVYPEKFVLDEGVQAYGIVKAVDSSLCLDTLSGNDKMEYDLGVYYYQRGTSTNQLFSLTQTHELRRENLCLDSSGDDGSVARMTLCFKKTPGMKWKHDVDQGTLIQEKSGKCLDRADLSSGDIVKVKPCNGGSSQKWMFESVSL